MKELDDEIVNRGIAEFMGVDVYEEYGILLYKVKKKVTVNMPVEGLIMSTRWMSRYQ